MTCTVISRTDSAAGAVRSTSSTSRASSPGLNQLLGRCTAFGRIVAGSNSGANRRSTPSTCRRSARCWPIRFSRSAMLPDNSARLSFKAATTCGSAITRILLKRWGYAPHTGGILQAALGGGCYIRPDILAHGGSPRRPLQYQLQVLPDLGTEVSRRPQTHSFAWQE